MTGLLKRLFGHPEPTDFDEEVERESAKARAFRMSDEVAEAARVLMLKARELQAEIEAIEQE